MTTRTSNKNVVAVETVKGEQTMKTETKQEFNTFDWVKGELLKAHFNAMINKSIPEDGVYGATMNGRFQSKVFHWLYKNDAVKVVSYKTETYTDEKGELKYKHTVYFKDLNLQAKSTSKAGKEFFVFSSKDQNKAKARLFNQLANA